MRRRTGAESQAASVVAAVNRNSTQLKQMADEPQQPRIALASTPAGKQPITASAPASDDSPTSAAVQAAHNAQIAWMAAAEEEVAIDDLQALLKETRGVFEKLAVSCAHNKSTTAHIKRPARASRPISYSLYSHPIAHSHTLARSLSLAQEGNLKLGSWQMVLWQPRWVHAETDALCYQKITADERPIGREKRIEFRDVKEIEELEYGEFVLQCSKRDYTFKAADEHKCQVIVHNLRQLRERWRASPEGQAADTKATPRGGWRSMLSGR